MENFCGVGEKLKSHLAAPSFFSQPAAASDALWADSIIGFDQMEILSDFRLGRIC